MSAAEEAYGVDDSIEVSFDGSVLRPVVYEIETRGTSKMQTLTDQCGNTETDKLGSGTVGKTVNALLYKEWVQEIYERYEQGDKVDVTLPAEVGEVTLHIQDVTVTQTRDMISMVEADSSVDREVFDTQIQLKAPGRETE
jgi:hypothetical protein